MSLGTRHTGSEYGESPILFLDVGRHNDLPPQVVDDLVEAEARGEANLFEVPC